MKVLKTLKEKVKAIRYEKKLAEMTKQADILHKADGKTYYVVPIVKDGKDSMCIINNNTHNTYNKQMKKLGGKHISFMELNDMALYKTKKQ